MEFSRQECWSGLPFLSSGDLSDPGIEPRTSYVSCIAGGFFITELPGKWLFRQLLPNSLSL